MEVYKYIDEIKQVSDLAKTNEYLNENYILIGTYIERYEISGKWFEHNVYCLGHVNMNRHFSNS